MEATRKIKKIIARHVKKPVEEISERDNILSGIQGSDWDLWGIHNEIIDSIEEEFDIPLEIDYFAEKPTIGEVIQRVKSQMNMTRKVKEIIARHLDKPIEHITTKMSFFEDFNFNFSKNQDGTIYCPKFYELLKNVLETFGLRLEDLFDCSWTTVRDIINIIASKKPL